MGVCFSSYGNQAYSRYTLYLSLLNDTSERQKVVDETTFYFAKLNDDGSYVMTDINITGFNMSDTSYYFNNIVAPSDRYILVSQDGEILGYKKSNGAVEKIVVNSDGGQYTFTNVMLYSVPDFATILYGNNTHLIINVPKEDREANIAIYGSEVKVYEGMTAETNWAHPYTADDIYKTRIKSVSFGSLTKPTTLREAFDGLQLCHTIDLTNLDTTDCENFRSTFQMCKELVNMDITKLIVTDKCTSLAGIFNNCMKYVINSDLLHWDTSNVVYFGTAFGNIGNTEFSPKIDTSSGQSFNSMFGYSPNIEVLDLSTFDTSNATDIGFMFIRCENLTTIYAKPTLVAPAGVSANRIFDFDTKLVGGGGTTYDQAHISTTRFYIDNPPSQLGYFTDKDATTYKTTLFTDGTFIINEKSTDRDANIVAHGAVVKEYAPLNATNNYVFTGASQVPWYSETAQIKHIKFGQAIQPTSTAYWFNGTTNIEDFDFTNLDTSKVTDMSYMFSGAGTQVAPDLSTFNTSRVTDMSGMFSSTMFNSIDCSSFNTHNVTDMDYMFEGSRASTINVSSFDTSNVTLMEGMFKNAVEVRTLNLSHFNTSNVTNMKEMFCGAQHMDTLNVSTWDTSSVTDMRAMFERAGQINGSGKTLDVSSLNVSNITDMTNMFADSGYSTINVTGWDTSNVTNMNSMFSGNWNVTELDLTSFDTSKVTNMNSMFNGCESLVTIKAEDTFNTGLVTSSSNMFFGCTSIKGGAGTTYNTTHIDKTYARKDNPPTAPGYFTGQVVGTMKTTLFTDGTFIINEKPENRAANIATHGAVTNEYAPLSEENPYVFRSSSERPWNAQVSNIQSVEFGSAINPTSMAFWYQSCTNLTSLNSVNLDTSNVTDMSYLFYGCQKLGTLDVSSWNTSNVTTMKSMFSLGISQGIYSNQTLTTLDLSNFNTSKVTDMSNMFAMCEALSTLDISSFDTSQVLNYSGMFNDCKALTSLDLKHFDTAKATTFNGMFTKSGIRSVDVSTWKTNNATSFNNMFGACAELLSVDLSNFDFTLVRNIRSMFVDCYQLTSIELGDSNTTYSLVRDSGDIFRSCRSLDTLIINGTTVLRLTASQSIESMKSSCQIKVPAELVNSYKTASNWSTRASYIVAI